MKNHKFNRRSIRLKGYDYSRIGAYFVPICAYNREPMFWEKSGNQTIYGKIIQQTWFDLPNHNDGIILDEFVVMPDHVHGIIQIIENNIVLLSEIVRQFKTFSARRINESRRLSGIPVWQRNYYEHIIRNDDELFRIRKYIRENPEIKSSWW
jgi:putative transposase